MNATIVMVVLALVLIALALTMSAGRGKRKNAPQVKAKQFMSANELEFLHRLETAVPEYRFHAQVAMGALLEPAVAGRANRRQYASARNMFSQKIVDYVAQRRDTGQIVAIIELDDRTHKPEKDAQRDAMLQQAGYRTVRWDAKNKPGRADILTALVEAPSLLKPTV